MAQFQGRVCDREGCNTTVDGAANTPPGWLKLVPVPMPDHQQSKDETLEFCSNYCLATVAILRHEAETDKGYARPKETHLF